jgi:hypothetical protein
MPRGDDEYTEEREARIREMMERAAKLQKAAKAKAAKTRTAGARPKTRKKKKKS